MRYVSAGSASMGRLPYPWSYSHTGVVVVGIGGVQPPSVPLLTNRSWSVTQMEVDRKVPAGAMCLVKHRAIVRENASPVNIHSIDKSRCSQQSMQHRSRPDRSGANAHAFQGGGPSLYEHSELPLGGQFGRLIHGKTDQRDGVK